MPARIDRLVAAGWQPRPGRARGDWYVPDRVDRSAAGARPGRQRAAPGRGPAGLAAPARSTRRRPSASGRTCCGAAQARRRAAARGRAWGCWSPRADQVAGRRRRRGGGDLPVADHVRRRARPRAGQVERLEALATWTESLRDSIAGSIGLEEAIRHSLTAAPPVLHPALLRLEGRLRVQIPLPQALAAVRRGVRGLLGRPGGRGTDPQQPAARPRPGATLTALATRPARRSTCAGGSRKAASRCGVRR